MQIALCAADFELAQKYRSDSSKMGCTSSKAARKRAAREGWNAPLSRCASAPIHYPAETEGDSCHVVSLTSSSYGILKMETPGHHADVGSFVNIPKAKQRFIDDSNDFLSEANADLKLKPVQEEDEMHNDQDPETINTWELMEGLEDIARTPSPLRADKRRFLEKSLSFSTVQELDSCLGDVGSPVWRKYFMQQESEKEKRSNFLARSPISASAMLFSMSPNNSKSISSIEPLDGVQSTESPVSVHTSLFRKDGPHPSFGGETEHFGILSRKISDAKTSPGIDRDGSKGCMSPLFDPALMASFEQALDGIRAVENDWLLLNHDGSTTNSSSSENNTWPSSETSSDAESPEAQRQGSLDGKLENSLVEKKRLSSKVSPICEEKAMQLDSFEQRCPPGGEGKAVLYFTSLRGVRKTYEDCCTLRMILQGLGVHVDERDVWMHSKFREEMTEMLGDKRLGVPRLFIKGRYIGGAEEVKQLHEEGILARLVQNLPSNLCRKVCDGCGDARFVPCFTCSGSCKLLDEYDQVVRCSICNENGLIMCPICS